MSKTNSVPEFRPPFYKKEEKLFFNHFSSSVLYPTITTELDFSESDGAEAWKSQKRSERKLLGVVRTPEIILFDDHPNDGGIAREGNTSIAVFIAEESDLDERLSKVGTLDAMLASDGSRRFEGDERLPTESSLLLSWRVPPLIFDEIERCMGDSSVDMKVHFLLDIWSNDDGILGIVAKSGHGFLSANEYAELGSIAFVKKNSDERLDLPEPKKRDWYKVSMISLLASLLFLQLLSLLN